jgi:O-antigen ligase
VTKERRPVGVLTPLSKAAFACLWCFVLVLPWDVYAELPVVGSIPRLAGIVASAVGVLYIVARRRVRPLSWFHGSALLFVFWAAISMLWSIDQDATRTRLMTYLQLALLVWLIWEIAWSPQRTRALVGAYVLGVSVAAIATVRDYVSGVHAAGYEGRFNALSVNPNELGMTLALGLPMAWYLSLAQPQRRFARLWQLYLPLAITAILLTASRGAFLTMLGALAIIPATQGRLRLRTKAALCVLAVASLVLAANFVPEATLERLQTTRADIESGYFGNRGFIWRAGLDVAREHPLLGVGAGTFGAAVEPSLNFEWSSHSVPLSILVEDGIVGLLIFLAMFGATITALRPGPPLQRRFGIVLLLTLGVGSLSLEWGYRKQFWFVLGIVAAEAALRPRSDRGVDLGSTAGSSRPGGAASSVLAADQ